MLTGTINFQYPKRGQDTSTLSRNIEIRTRKSEFVISIQYSGYDECHLVSHYDNKLIVIFNSMPSGNKPIIGIPALTRLNGRGLCYSADAKIFKPEPNELIIYSYKEPAPIKTTFWTRLGRKQKQAPPQIIRTMTFHQPIERSSFSEDGLTVLIVFKNTRNRLVEYGIVDMDVF